MSGKRVEAPGSELLQAEEKLLPGGFNGSTMWYLETTKLDLEARQLIERLNDTESHRYRRVV